MPVLGILGLSGGCAACAREKESSWIQPPQVHWTDLATERVPAIRDSYIVLTGGPTQGLFPASIAVTRVALDGGTESSSSRALELVRDPRNEFLQWNKVFDDLMAVAEVFPIEQRDLGGSLPEPVQINAAMRALTGRLGLIYAVNQTAPDVSEMFGVLYDTSAARPVAALHASAKTLIPPRPCCNCERESVDLWNSDSRALARKKFEELAHACLHELIAMDRPVDPQPEEGWIPVNPLREVEWPPRETGTN